MKIRTVYGVHPSRCFKASLGIDPLLPPKKCIYNCIYCPQGITVEKTSEARILVNPQRVLRELDEYIRVNGCIFNNVMIWGSGDPLLNYHTPLIASSIKEYLKKEKCDVTITLRTTGYLLSEDWARQVILYVDKIIIPLDAPVDLRRIVNDPLKGYTLLKLAKILRELGKEFKRKIWFEINLFRTSEYTNASLYIIDELLSVIHSSGITKVFVKTINRPGRVKDLKPVRGKQFSRVIERLVNEGLRVETCREQDINVVVVDNSDEALINHILRKPLSSDEIRQIYGVEGLLNAERLATSNVLGKTTWSNRVFYYVSHGIIQYMF